MRVVLIILLFISFAGLAQQNEDQQSVPPVFSVEAASQTLQETVLNIWYDFIAHTPYIVVAIFILLLTGVSSMLISKLIGNMFGRS